MTTEMEPEEALRIAKEIVQAMAGGGSLHTASVRRDNEGSWSVSGVMLSGRRTVFSMIVDAEGETHDRKVVTV